MTPARYFITIAVQLLALLSGTPASAQSARDVEINRRTLRADLEVAPQPRSSQEVPTSFVVRNRGLRETGAFLLSVSIRVLPLSRENIAEYERVHGERYVGRSAERMCDLPYSDFQVAVDPLKPNQSHTAVPPSLRTSRTAQIGAQMRASDAVARLDNSVLTALRMVFTCVYEVRITVDADNQVEESDERNNVVVHRFQREHHQDLFHYFPRR